MIGSGITVKATRKKAAAHFKHRNILDDEPVRVGVNITHGNSKDLARDIVTKRAEKYVAFLDSLTAPIFIKDLPVL